jgi:membrane protease subunit HflC
VAFYEFTRTMQAYESLIADNTTLVLSTDSDLFKFLKGMSPDGEAGSIETPPAVDKDAPNAAASARSSRRSDASLPVLR